MKKYTHQIGAQIFDIFVGTNAKENWDLIDLAEPEDLWFHVEYFPSGHVLIKERFEAKTNLHQIHYPNQIISIGSQYCKTQSKYKDKKKLKIIYTQISNIKKGKTIGSVYVGNSSHIYI